MKCFTTILFRLIAAIITFCLGTQAAIAQLDSEQSQDFYRIEIIVFRHAVNTDPAYRWPGQPDIRLANDLFRANTEAESILDLLHGEEPHQAVYGDAAANLDVLRDPNSTGPAMVEIEQPSPIEPLDTEEFLLADAWRRLDRNRGYQPLVHLGWRQPAAPFSDALPIRIHGGAVIVEAVANSPLSPFTNDNDPGSGIEGVEELDGSIAFERSRFLHLHIDLALHVPFTAQADNPQAATPLLDQSILPDFDEPYRTYRLVERRQIKTGSINYFDHRRFGVIALVNKWEPPEEEPPIEEPAHEEPLEEDPDS